jgi:hypothetical protein
VKAAPEDVMARCLEHDAGLRHKARRANGS